MFVDGLIDGLVLAATAMGDTGGEAVRRGLAPGLERALAERLSALDELGRAKRHAAVKAIVSSLASVPVDIDVPPRVARILASDVPREIGRAWEDGAPRVRRGFVADRSLRTFLRRAVAPRDPSGELDHVRRAPWRA